MGWLADQIPWWVWLLISVSGIGAGGVALIIFVPAALPILLGIWNRLPLWLKAVLFALGAAPFVYLAGRNAGSRRERDKNRDRAENAVRNRLAVDQDIKRMSPSDVDKALEQKGDFRD